MPFFEVNDFAGEDLAACRRRAASEMTAALATAYAIETTTISSYFIAFANESYAHAGELGPSAEARRLLVKLHGFGRPLAVRRRAAELVSGAAANAYGMPAKNVIVYFLDRTREEVAHGGVLECDRT
jgi:phenylpyruvate tautomerase PptA (4-oxalocrotonate tautomerase family)